MNFGKTILELRKSNGITQEDLAAELGVTAAAVSKWEHGYTLPDILMLCALADYFEVTTDVLLGRTKEAKYALIVAESPELGRKIAALAKQYGIVTVGDYADCQSAFDAAPSGSDVDLILICCEEARFTVEDAETPARILVSLGETEQETLNGFESMFRELK